MDSDYFLIDEIEKKLIITHTQSNEKVSSDKIINVDINGDEIHIQTEDAKIIQSIFDDFYKQLISLNLNNKQTDEVLRLSEFLIRGLASAISSNTQNRKEVNETTELLCQKIIQRNSQSKRKREIQKNENFVPAQETAIGMQWKYKLNSTKEIPNHFLTQTKYHYVSIVDTLKSLFSNPAFKRNYMDYNLNQKHKCSDGVYVDFCCGQIAKECELFQVPETIMIELYSDDYEVCSALKSKANVHNVTGVYFRIRNLPSEYNSRQEHIHLVALCKVQDLKMEGVSFDDIAKVIIKEIQSLQTEGIDIGNSTILKGTLINICGDNLGLNGLFKMIKCFRVDGFCRICEITKEASEKQTKEIPDLLRRVENYADCITAAENGDRVGAKGIVQYCLFNDLDNFHIFRNNSIDIMHDVLEGSAHVFMKFFFRTMIDRKILKFSDISRMVRDFTQGIIKQKNKSSIISMTNGKIKLNQNATQAHTLLKNLPFIFYEQKDHLCDIWLTLTKLLQINQIIFSSINTDRDIDRLSTLISMFLSELIEHEVSLTPKLHHMVHYPTVIKRMGPLIHMWCMRMESKHKEFTKIARCANNFKNITETLSSRHQQLTCYRTDMFSDKIIASHKKKKFGKIRT